MARNLVEYDSAPFNGPMAITANLLDSVAAAPFEGLWVPTRYAKQGSCDVLGTFSALDVELYISNGDGDPGNQWVATIGGTVTTGDTLTLTFKGPYFPTGSHTVSYTTVGGNTTTTIAAALAAAIVGDSTLAALGISASNSSAVMTITWPSMPPTAAAGSFTSPSSPVVGNLLTVSASVSGSATETVTFTTGTNGVDIRTISTVGVFGLSMPFRWLKARLISMTGSSITMNFAGVA